MGKKRKVPKLVSTCKGKYIALRGRKRPQGVTFPSLALLWSKKNKVGKTRAERTRLICLEFGKHIQIPAIVHCMSRLDTTVIFSGSGHFMSQCLPGKKKKAERRTVRFVLN